MAATPGFIGSVRKGDRVRFLVDSIDGTWAATHFDVIDGETFSPVSHLMDQTTDVPTDGPPSTAWVDFPLLDDFDTDGTRLFTFVEGRMYAVRVKSGSGDPPASNAFTMMFRVEPEDRRAFLGVVEKGKDMFFIHREENRDELWYDVIDPRDGNAVYANVAMTGPMTQPGGARFFSGQIETEGTDDLAVGRTYWVRVKDIRAEDPNLDALYSFTVLPRLEYELARLLAYAGENVVMDNFSYDQAGNVVGLRVRLFSNASDADNATSGVTEPEPGEIANLQVDQEHNIPRNVRTFHKSILEFRSSTFPQEQ